MAPSDESQSILALVQAANPDYCATPKTDAQRKIQTLMATVSKMQTTAKESSRCCDQLMKRSRHLESLTTPASDASASLSAAANNLAATLQAMKDAREKFETVSDCEPTIIRLNEGVMEMELRRNRGDRKGGIQKMGAGASNPFDDNEALQTSGNVVISEQDVYSAADSMEIIKDAFDYFLERKHWKSAPTALGGLERVHKTGVNSMCTLLSSYLLSAGPAIRVKRAMPGTGKEEGKGGGPILPSKTETAVETRTRHSTALENRDLMRAIGDYEECQPVETRPVREMRAVLECLGGDGYHLGPARRKEPSALTTAYGVKASNVVRTEKVGSGGYTSLVQDALTTGFPQLDAYGEARKEIAFKAIDDYYRRLKMERKKNVGRNGDEADNAARDAIRCLEHAMVIVAGEKSIYRAVVAPSATPRPNDEDAPTVTPWYQKACVAAFSYVAAAVVDRTMDIIETVFLKEGGIGQTSGSKTENHLSVRDAGSAAAAGLRMLDGVRMLGPSLSKLCDIPLSEGASAIVKPGIMPVASTLCIAIHRTTVKNAARTLENLAKAIQEDPLNGSKYRPPDARIAPVSSDVVRAIRLLSPFVSAYKSVTKRRALPWDPNIGEEAGEMESFVKYVVMRLRNSLAGKALNYTRDPGEDNMAKSNMFMINNAYYLMQQLGPEASLDATPNDAEHYRIEGAWFEADMQKTLDTEKAKYLGHWEILNQHLSAVDTSGLTFSANNVLSRESGKLFKARFGEFNDEFERLYKLHRMLTVIDPNLRITLQQEVINVFVPRYHRFYEKYSGIKFSKKHQDEYLKYTPKKIESMLGKLYTS